MIIDYGKVLDGPYSEYVQAEMDRSPIYINWDTRPGMCEYNLYAHIADQVHDSVILDIGTGGGGSAWALAYNDSNLVVSYDIAEREVHAYLRKDNIELRIGDFMDDNIDYDRVSVIMIDVDPHDGVQERVMLDHLRDVEWTGFLLMDDISDEWPPIKEVWDQIEYQKFDLTDIGHWSGTGIANFGNSQELVVVL